MPRIGLGIFSQTRLVVHETGEREKGYCTMLNTGIAHVRWRAGTHSALEGSVWCKEWERMALVTGMWVCFFNESSPRSSHTLNKESSSSIHQRPPAQIQPIFCLENGLSTFTTHPRVTIFSPRLQGLSRPLPVFEIFCQELPYH